MSHAVPCTLLLAVSHAVALHRRMVRDFAGAPGVSPIRMQEGLAIRHCALSLVGEPYSCAGQCVGHQALSLLGGFSSARTYLLAGSGTLPICAPGDGLFIVHGWAAGVTVRAISCGRTNFNLYLP